MKRQTCTIEKGKSRDPFTRGDLTACLAEEVQFPVL